MSSKEVNLVWLKRDLRLQNHAPLQAAENDGNPYRTIYLFEPSLIEPPDTSLRHLQFVFKSIDEIGVKLRPYNRQVDLFYGNAQPVFEWLLDSCKVKRVFSYQESGTQATWDRDKQVRALMDRRHATWTEFQRDGILRGITDRKGWDSQWFKTMAKPLIENKYSKATHSKLNHPFPLPPSLQKDFSAYPIVLQTPGEDAAHRTLKSFAKKRGFSYRKFISKPEQSRESHYLGGYQMGGIDFWIQGIGEPFKIFGLKVVNVVVAWRLRRANA